MNSIYSIKDLNLNNFKCYDDTPHTVRFGSELTIIIGQNGAGKTALLNGIKKVVSIILARDRRRDVKFIGDGLNIRQNTIKEEDARYNFDYSEGGEDYEFPVVLSCNGIIRGEDASWYMEKANKGSRSVMTYREALDKFLEPFNNGNLYPKLPLLCFFSDSYPHVRNDMSIYEKDILFNKSENPARAAGYYRWDANSTDFYLWTGMYINAYKKINDTVNGLNAIREQLQQPNLSEKGRANLEHRLEIIHRLQQEVEYVSSFLKSFSHKLQDFSNEEIEISSIGVGHHLNNSGKEVDSMKLMFTNGGQRYFDMLPEGHKRLFSIVFEIAYRHFTLNRALVLNNPQCRPEGIVIIDEIELHLHPSLAEETISRLRQTFPDVQFIVTTHSPLIVSSVFNDGANVRVLKLDKSRQFTMAENCFNSEYSDTLVLAMGAYNSMRFTQRLRQRYIEACEAGNAAGKTAVRNNLIDFIGHTDRADAVADNIIADWEEIL